MVVHRTEQKVSEGSPFKGTYPKHLESSMDEQAVKGQALFYIASEVPLPDDLIAPIFVLMLSDAMMKCRSQTKVKSHLSIRMASKNLFATFNFHYRSLGTLKHLLPRMAKANVPQPPYNISLSSQIPTLWIVPSIMSTLSISLG